MNDNSTPLLSARKTIIAWTPVWAEDYDKKWKSLGAGSHPTAGQVKLGPFLGECRFDWTDSYLMTDGACWICWRNCPEVELLARLMTTFNTLVVRDGLDPLRVHQTFLKLQEYRGCISPDSPGLQVCSSRRRRLIKPSMRFRLLREGGYKCCICGRSSGRDGVKLEIDHIVPVSRGGSSDEGNLQVLCRECNRGKSVGCM